MATWDVEWVRASVAEVHGRDLPAVVHRRVRVVEVGASALVLGSTQSADDVDAVAAERLGVDVVRRRSGGGAVLLDPGGALWIDVEIGRRDDLWLDDVGRSAQWLGLAWAEALGDAGASGAAVHDGAMATSPAATVVCFAGLAPGEVTIDGAKVVGVSQRRTRAGARFQCAVPVQWDAERHGTLLAPGLARVGADAGSIRVRTIVDTHVLLDAFLERLDRLDR